MLTAIRRTVAGISPTGAGIIIMLGGMLMFSLNDAMGKWLLSTYSIGQLILIRSIAALVVLIPIMAVRRMPSPLKVTNRGQQALRVALSTAEVFCFYFAVQSLPLADVMTYWLAAPIYVAAMSPLLLGERVGWRRWLAIFAGFIGVIITLEPSAAALSPATLVSIFGTMAFALIMILGRKLRQTPDTSLVFWQTIGALLAGAATAPFAWTPMESGSDLLLLATLGVVAMLAHMLVNRSLKLADAATVAPLQYTLLLWGIVFGWMFFGDLPRAGMLVGAALIIASGLFIFFRERSLKMKIENPPVTPDMP